MKKRFSILFILAILTLLAYVLKEIDFYMVYQLLIKINLSWFFISFILIGVMFLVWNIRFIYSLKSILNIKPNFFYLFTILMSGVFMNTVTPGSNIGGEPVRAYYLKKKYKKPKSKFLGAILADKAFNVSVFAFFLIFSIFFVFVFMGIPFYFKFILEFLIILSFLIILLVLVISKERIYKFLFSFKRINKKFKSYLIFKMYLNKKIKNFSSSFKKIFLNKKKFVWNIALSLVVWILIYSSSYFLFLAFGQNINFLYVIVVVTLGYLIGDLSPVPGGIGVVESVMILLYSAGNVPIELALSTTLLSRIIYYFYALLIGGGCLLYLKLRWKK